MYCGTCGAHVNYNETKCEKCGNNIWDGTEYCQYCGEKTDDNINYCPNCKRSLYNEDDENETNQPYHCKRCGNTEWVYEKAGLNIRGAIRSIFLSIIIILEIISFAAVYGMVDNTYPGLAEFIFYTIILLAVLAIILVFFITPYTMIKNHGKIYRICTKCGRVEKLVDNINDCQI